MVNKATAPKLILGSLLSKRKQNEYGKEHSADYQVHSKDMLYYLAGRVDPKITKVKL